MRLRTILPCALALSLSAITASAQDLLEFRADVAAHAEQAGGIQVLSLDPVSMGPTVTGAPYSAEAVTEVTQPLFDGNRIERRMTASIARSSDGRIRREQSGFALGTLVSDTAQPIVTISDPRSGVHYTLNYDQKIAYRMKPPPMFFNGDPTEGGTVAFSVGRAGVRGGVISSRSQPFERALPPPPMPGVGPDEMPFNEPVFAAPPVAGARMLRDTGFVTETLEARTIEGVRAEGTRSTMTIPAGTIGNAQPIEVVQERWYSPELQVVLMTRRSDPRFGETVYRLTNIVRAEPAPELFKVPAGFKVESLK